MKIIPSSTTQGKVTLQRGPGCHSEKCSLTALIYGQFLLHVLELAHHSFIQVDDTFNRTVKIRERNLFKYLAQLSPPLKPGLTELLVSALTHSLCTWSGCQGEKLDS